MLLFGKTLLFVLNNNWKTLEALHAYYIVCGENYAGTVFYVKLYSV